MWPFYRIAAYRLQRGDRRVQKHQLYRVGRRRPGQDSPPLETLLPEHARPYLRGGQQRSRACWWGTRGADAHAGWGWASWCSPSHLCEQTGTKDEEPLLWCKASEHISSTTIGSPWKQELTNRFHFIPGSAKCHERRGDHRQARPALTSQSQLVHPGHLCNHRWRPLRGSRLAVQPAEVPKVVHPGST